MLIVRVFVNDTEIALATAGNLSELADVSDYECYSSTRPFPDRTKPITRQNFFVEDHDRNQTVWSLVEKMAARITELEKKNHGDR